MLQKLMLIAMAGGLGTLARYGLSGVVQRAVPNEFPWGTVAVNLLGCVVFGITWAALDRRLAISGETRAIILVGFMGAFTTFSTFAFDTSQMMRDSQWLAVGSHLAIQNVGGIAAMLLGIAIGRWV